MYNYLQCYNNVLEYIAMILRRFNVIKRVVEGKKLQSQQAQLERQERVFSEHDEFAVGDLVFLYAPTLSGLQSSSRKFKQEWIGPLQIQAVLDRSHFLLADWQGKLLPFFGSVHINCLRHCYIFQYILCFSFTWIESCIHKVCWFM